MTRLLNTFATAGLALGLGTACVEQEPKNYDDQGSDSDQQETGWIAAPGGAASSNAMVTIPVQVSTARLGLLSDATTFTIELVDCASGYTSTANQASTALLVYKYDSGCVAKLTTFTFNGKTLIPTSADPFTTWQANDTATFDEANEAGTYAASLKVISQLDDPVSGAEAVVYQFSELNRGNDEELLQANVSEGHPLTVGSQNPPSFTIASAQLININANGGGQFLFKLACTSSIGNTNACEGVNMNLITYKLIEDTYGSDLNIAEANALFPAGETVVTMPDDRIAPGAQVANGGFQTIVLDGPDRMADKPNMIFIMQANDWSYQYFNVDVATLSQD